MIFCRNKKHAFDDKIYDRKIKDEIKEILIKIEYILSNNGHFGQANFITILQDNLENKEFDEFYKNYNSVDMWGGSGAVWEVYFEDEIKDKEFSQHLGQLNCLMEKIGNKNERAKSTIKYLNK